MNDRNLAFQYALMHSKTNYNKTIMKKKIFFLSTLLALGFSGCSNEENIETGNSEEIRVAVTFDIGTTTRAIDDSYLKEVTLYTFKADGEFVDAQTTTMNGGSITFPGKGSYLIEAIANENSDKLQGLKDYEDFKTRTTVYDNATAGRLQMRDVQTAELTNVSPRPSIHFSMRRLVSRINIVNNVEGFVLTKATLAGAMKQSYFYKSEDESMDYWNLNPEETEDKTVTAFTPSQADGNTYNSVFYVYECPNDQCELALDVEGTIDGIEHAVPTLDKEAFLNDKQHAPLRRNAQYTVELNEVDGAIVATLEVSDWDEGEETEGAIVSPNNGNTIEVTVEPAETTGGEYTIADEAERKVEDLAVYLFDAAGKLEKAHTGLLSEPWTPESTGKGQKITLNNILTKEAKTLYIVANAAANKTASLENLAADITASDFEALMATAATGNLSCPLLMFKKVEISAEEWTEDVVKVSAVLERAAARIDLRVKVESGFIPETVKLVNANNQSLVIASTAAAATDPLTLEATVKTSEAKEGYLDYPQLFYTYSIGSTEGMYLLLEGTQQSGDNTAQAIYKKPLSEMEFNAIAHNTCYTITIEDVKNVPLVTEGGVSGGVADDD